MNTHRRFEVRRATSADAAALAQLRFAFRAPRAAAIESETDFVGRAEEWMAKHLSQADRWRAWVVLSDGAIVGNIWLQIVEKLPNPGAESERHGYVTNFFVRPEFRGAGAGSTLLSILKQDCEALNVDTIFLWATLESRPLYLRNGFKSSDDVVTFHK